MVRRLLFFWRNMLFSLPKAAAAPDFCCPAFYLFDHGVPALVILAHLHLLLVEKQALLWN